MCIRLCVMQGRYISDITLEEVQQYTNVPAHVACERLGLGLTSFKRLCRGLGISAWPYKKDASLPAAYASGYAHGASNSYPNDGFGWPSSVPLSRAASGPFASSPAIPGPSYNPNYPPAEQYAYSPPPVAPAAVQPQGSVLHDLLRDATAASLAHLLDQLKQLSAEMRTILGLSIIDDAAVDIIRGACLAIEVANQSRHHHQQQQPPPPAESNPVAALMAILGQMRGTIQPK
jgi:hypothetical protein